MKYKIKNIIPENMRCAAGACPSIYKGVREVTPKTYQCFGGTCPSIYKGVREVTPKEMQCVNIACLSAYSAKKGQEAVYLIVGKTVNPKDAGLEKRVGEGEALVEIPRALIDDKGK